MSRVLRLLLVGAMASGVLVLTSSAASAGCQLVPTLTEHNGQFVTVMVMKCSGSEPATGSEEQTPVTVDQGCAEGSVEGHLDPLDECMQGGNAGNNPANQPGVTNALVYSAMRRVAPPAARLIVQPPGGKTLVNFDTIFSTEAEPFQRTVRLLGHEVRLKIWASAFSWHFGDGAEPLSTREAGRKYQRGLPMDSYITHRYKDADVTVRPRVNTTYSAEYSVDGGPFQPVIGTVTIAGAPATLRVVEARPVLTGTR